MKFETILRAAGVCERLYVGAGCINVKLYDEKDRIIEDENLQFHESLFSKNSAGFDQFLDIVDNLESDSESPSSVKVKITPEHVIVFYETPNAIAIPRNPMNPLDYMD